MELVLGFPLDAWDYATFASLFVIGAAFIVLIYLILGLPGRIAIARRHPEAEVVNMMGWLGFIAVVPWVQAFIGRSNRPTSSIFATCRVTQGAPPTRKSPGLPASPSPRRLRRKRCRPSRTRNRSALEWSPDC